MSRRSSRRVAASTTTTASLPPNIERGLASFVEGNERLVSSMLSIDLKKDNDNTQLLVSALSDCIRMNDLSIEAFLTRFFDKSVLSDYCINKLATNYKVSGKGNEAILAARIGKIWSKPDFELLKEIEIEKETAAAAAAVDDVAAAATKTTTTTTTTKKKKTPSSNGTKKKRQEKDAAGNADKVKSKKKFKKGGRDQEEK
jgi:hypothetical protein